MTSWGDLGPWAGWAVCAARPVFRGAEDSGVRSPLRWGLSVWDDTPGRRLFPITGWSPEASRHSQPHVLEITLRARPRDDFSSHSPVATARDPLPALAQCWGCAGPGSLQPRSPRPPRRTAASSSPMDPSRGLKPTQPLQVQAGPSWRHETSVCPVRLAEP